MIQPETPKIAPVTYIYPSKSQGFSAVLTGSSVGVNLQGQSPLIPRGAGAHILLC